MDINAAARLGRHTNLVHGFIYFATEATEEYDAIGLPAETQYFSSRAAAMGAVNAEVVIATFFNFNPEIVRVAVPAGWDAASPADIQLARLRAAGRVLDRVAGDALTEAEIAEATEIATRMAGGVGFEGKPLAAANSAVALPEDPLTRLWQIVSTIREWRGDAHVAVLAASPVTAVEALVLHAATGLVSKEALLSSRRWPDEAWDAAVEGLTQRGLLDPDGSFTENGEAFRNAIERQTDLASMPLVNAVGVEDTHRLVDLLTPIGKALLASDVFPERLARSRRDSMD